MTQELALHSRPMNGLFEGELELRKAVKVDENGWPSDVESNAHLYTCSRVLNIIEYALVK